MRTSWMFVPLVAASLVLGACGDDDDTGDSSPSTPSGASQDSLQGKTFESTSVTGHELVADSVVTLAFADSDMSARAGCNTLGGAYLVEGDSLEFPDEFRTTMMACDQALMDQDAWLTEWLRAGVTWSLDGEQLTLEGDDTTMVLQLDA